MNGLLLIAEKVFNRKFCLRYLSFSFLPNLLLTNVVVPKINGRALSEKLTSLMPLYMSGYTAQIIRFEAIQGGSSNFIQKPLLFTGGKKASCSSPGRHLSPTYVKMINSVDI